MSAKTILVVDDSATVRQQLCDVLKPKGYEVIQGKDGADGLAQAKAHAVDLIIVDVNMPNVDGITMVEAVRRLPAHAKTPIFVLTTESGTRVKDGKRVGVTAWIVKPFKPESLLAAITKVLGAA